jgi:hypothetical protein
MLGYFENQLQRGVLRGRSKALQRAIGIVLLISGFISGSFDPRFNSTGIGPYRVTTIKGPAERFDFT